jgi:hypothetical protein
MPISEISDFAVVSVGVEQVQVDVPADPLAPPVRGVVIVAVGAVHGSDRPGGAAALTAVGIRQRT